MVITVATVCLLSFINATRIIDPHYANTNMAENAAVHGSHVVLLNEKNSTLVDCEILWNGFVLEGMLACVADLLYPLAYKLRFTI